MRKLVIYTAVLGLSGAAGLATSFFVANQPAPAEISRPVPLAAQAKAAAAGAHAATEAVTLANIAGGTNSVQDWAGKPRLVNFWATWCAPCRREIPLLKQLQAAQQPAGLQVIGIAHDEMAAVTEYAADMQINYPVLVGELEVVAAAEAFGVPLKGLPFTLVLSAEGELVNTHVGEIDEAEAAEIIDVMSRLQSGALSLADARAALGD